MDYLHLVRVGDRWVIVNAIYEWRRRTCVGAFHDRRREAKGGQQAASISSRYS